MYSHNVSPQVIGMIKNLPSVRLRMPRQVFKTATHERVRPNDSTRKSFSTDVRRPSRAVPLLTTVEYGQRPYRGIDTTRFTRVPFGLRAVLICVHRKRFRRMPVDTIQDR